MIEGRVRQVIAAVFSLAPAEQAIVSCVREVAA